MVSSSSGVASSCMLHVHDYIADYIYDYIAETRAFHAAGLTVQVPFWCMAMSLKDREYGSHLYPETAGRETEEAGLRPSPGLPGYQLGPFQLYQHQ